MTAQTEALLTLLFKAVEHVRASRRRFERSEAAANQMAGLLDDMSAELADVEAQLKTAEACRADTARTIRMLEDALAGERRASAAAEARAIEAELRIHQAASALGLSAPGDRSGGPIGEGSPSAALH